MTNKELLNKKIGFISLGCDKNRVDLEKIIALVKNAGFSTVDDVKDASIVIINTCSFIESARKESVDVILNTINYKAKHCEKIIVTGCLNQMNYTDLESSLPEVDYFLKVADNDKIVNIIYGLYGLELKESANYCNTNRVLTTPHHFAYLKISEGCNNFCSYCTIPYIRGRFVSTPMEQLINEATSLAQAGVKELILVGQDVTKYGFDLYGKNSLVKLIQELSKIDGIKWIRLLYCYPELVDDELIAEMKNNDKVVKYIDLPIQHINSDILKSMNRRTDKNKILGVIHKLKTQIPNIAIRTTFILGFPGESQQQFEEVIKFLKDEKLTNVGFFAYSREEGTRAYSFPNQVPTRTKNARVKKAYLTQQLIVNSNNKDLLNKTYDVIIDELENDIFIGRTYMSAPEVDTVVYMPALKNVKVGDIVKVKITNIIDYDLEGEIL